MIAVRLFMAISALVLQLAAGDAERECAKQQNQDHVMLQMTKLAVDSVYGSGKELCRSDCETRTQTWTKKCTFHSCQDCAECTSSSKQLCRDDCFTRTHPWSKKCTFNSCKDCAECATPSTSTTTTTIALRCESWCEWNSKEWSVKCAWDFPGACSGCTACSPSWPTPSTQEFPDARSISYEDWQCEKICQANSELVEGSGKGCCAYTDGECQFYPGGSVNEKGYVKGRVAWDCESDKRGGGKCLSSNYGKTCKGASPEVAIQFVPTPESSGNLVAPRRLVLDWSEEFDDCPSGKPDPRFWSFEAEQRADRLQWYTEKNAKCVDGKLVITAKEQTPMEAGFSLTDSRGENANKVYAAHFKYTSSSLTSMGKRSFVLGGRGKVEMRAKIDVRSGAFPAWWTMGEPDDFKTPCNWPGCGEIDIMEYVGGTGWMKTNFCTPRGGDDACSWNTGCECDWNNVNKAVNKTWADDFHTWVMEWDEGKDLIKVTLDGALFNSQTFSDADPVNTGRPENPFRGKRMYMILNLALGFVGGDPTPTTFPMKFEVDYVRAYKEK